MTWPETTRSLLLCVILFLVVYNIVIMRFVGSYATISRVTLQECSDHPVLALAAGVVIGHIFWPN